MRAGLLTAGVWAAVLTWGVGGLAWYGSATPLSVVEDAATPEIVARVRPQPEAPAPPAEPEPTPPEPVKTPKRRDSAPSRPQPAAPPIPPQPVTPPIPVGAAEVEAGEALLAAAGGFPALTCSYGDFPSFESYARAMLGLGARFVVVANRRIVASIDPVSGQMEAPSAGARFSPRARDYTGERSLAPLARSARERHGASAVVMMLVPRRVDAGLFGAISGALAARGEAHDDYREIHGRYERAPGGGVRLRVEAATRLDGSRVTLPLLFDLGRLARSA